MMLGGLNKLNLGYSLVSILQQWPIADADAHEQGKHVVTLIKHSDSCSWKVFLSQRYYVCFWQWRQQKSGEVSGLYLLAMVIFVSEILCSKGKNEGKNPAWYGLTFPKDFVKTCYFSSSSHHLILALL